MENKEEYESGLFVEDQETLARISWNELRKVNSK